MSARGCGRQAAALLAVALLAAACGDAGAEQDTAVTTVPSAPLVTTTTTVPEGPIAALTGLALGAAADRVEDAAIMVKISNNDSSSLAALVGIEQADVVIEERIEDRATRFAAIFHTNRPELVGAVRSGRPADIELMGNLGQPLLAFSGAFPSVLRDIAVFAGDGGAVLVVDDGGGVNLFRDDENFNRPDNLFVDLAFIFDKFGDEAGTAVPIFEFLGKDSSQSSNAVAADGVTVVGRDIVSFVWDPTRGYVRVQDGAVHVTREDVPLIAHNLVVMETVYTPSTYDPRNVDAHTTGSGPASVLMGGQRWEGTWHRETAADPYAFVDVDGESILLEPGRTWLTLVPPATYEFAVDSDIAALVLETEG